MSSNVERILVCGDVEGNYNLLIKRVTAVHQKSGPFSRLLCVGEFFGPDISEWLAIKKGTVKFPLPTYILGPHNEDYKLHFQNLKGCELCENVVYLGPSGIYPCNSGLRIAYLSGEQSNEASRSKNALSFNFDDITLLELQATTKPQVDILITSQWPSSVCNYARTPDGWEPDARGSAMIARLAMNILPRYHFSGREGIFYERLPYRNHKVLVEPARHVTRFIALASVGNKQKLKWLYAFNITPLTHCAAAELTHQPPDVTECPYALDNTAKAPAEPSKNVEGTQFFYDMNAKVGGDDDRRSKKRRGEDSGEDGKRNPPKPTGPCWFCLASPEVEKHLVVSVGNFSYLAMAKGGLTPDHLLILPITHFQCTADLEQDCRQEIEKFKSSLTDMFKDRGQRPVFFERNYRSQHLQVQVVPIPEKMAMEVFNTFKDCAEEGGLDLDEIPKHSDISQVAPLGSPYFYAELPSGQKLYHRIKKSFPLQFGRDVLASASLLNVPERVDWRECKMARDQETELRNKIRALFKHHDFTLEEDDEGEEDD